MEGSYGERRWDGEVGGVGLITLGLLDVSGVKWDESDRVKTLTTRRGSVSSGS